jgi:hypothetical protein
MVLCSGVEIAVIARISAAGKTVVEMTATAAGLPSSPSAVVAWRASIGIPDRRAGSGCSKRRNAPSKSRRQTIATMRARRGVMTSERCRATWVERATRVMALSIRISIQPL